MALVRLMQRRRDELVADVQRQVEPTAATSNDAQNATR